MSVVDVQFGESVKKNEWINDIYLSVESPEEKLVMVSVRSLSHDLSSEIRIGCYVIFKQLETESAQRDEMQEWYLFII